MLFQIVLNTISPTITTITQKIMSRVFGSMHCPQLRFS